MFGRSENTKPTTQHASSELKSPEYPTITDLEKRYKVRLSEKGYAQYLSRRKVRLSEKEEELLRRYSADDPRKMFITYNTDPSAGTINLPLTGGSINALTVGSNLSPSAGSTTNIGIGTQGKMVGHLKVRWMPPSSLYPLGTAPMPDVSNALNEELDSLGVFLAPEFGPTTVELEITDIVKPLEWKIRIQTEFVSCYIRVERYRLYSLSSPAMRFVTVAEKLRLLRQFLQKAP